MKAIASTANDIQKRINPMSGRIDVLLLALQQHPAQHWKQGIRIAIISPIGTSRIRNGKLVV